MVPFTPPKYSLSSFNCPHCRAFAQQAWGKAYAHERVGFLEIESLSIAVCQHCSKYSVWLGVRMIYPEISVIEPPNIDLDGDIQTDYKEAEGIVQKSPRGAAALLRLAVQKLCKQLGQPGENINNDIANLVKIGLPEKIQKALDTVRVTGNGAVHPGTLDLKDDVETAQNLFKLINFIAEKMITEPREVDKIFESLPENKKEEIKKRDGK